MTRTKTPAPMTSSREVRSNSTSDEPDNGIGRPPASRRAGPFVFVSGVCSQVSSAMDVRDQTRSCIDSISSSLQAAGGGLENLVEVTTFLARMEDFAAYNDAYSKYFSIDGPARTTVAVEELSDPNALIEMRGVAYIAEDTNPSS